MIANDYVVVVATESLAVHGDTADAYLHRCVHIHMMLICYATR